MVCRNLTVSVFKGFDTYRGTAQFSDGTVKIQSYDAFRADMQTRFNIDGGQMHARATSISERRRPTAVDRLRRPRNWPEMLYNVKSRIDFPIQKEIFFKDMNFTVAGYGDFTARSISSRRRPAGRELKGTFTSPRRA